MTRKRDRFFALFGALLFLVTASALTIAIVVSNISSSHQNSNAQDQAAKDAATQQCQDTQSEPKLPVPDVYKPTGTVSKLETTDLTTGAGPAAKTGDCLVMKYYGTLAANGTKFDENFTSNLGFAFNLGEGQVIKGWDEGLVGMQAGGTRRLVIPAALGYGNQAAGVIPPNSDLVFVVKLIRIQK